MPHRRRVSLLIILFTLALTVVGCQPGAAAEEEAAAEAAALDLAVQNTNPIISATGEVLPEEYANLSFALGGEIDDLLVAVGDVVSAGDVLARLDSTDLEAGLAAAEAGLAAAEASLAKTKAGPTEEEIDAAESQLSAAYARTSAAAARKEAIYDDVTESQLEDANVQIEQANLQRDQLVAALDSLASANFSGIEPSSYHPAAQGETLAYQLELADQNLAAAQATLTDLLDGPTPEAIRLADAQIGLANAQAAAAQARLDLLLARPFAEDIAVAEAEVAQAQASVAAAAARIEQAVLRAPFAGTISSVSVDAHEFVAPGQAIVLLGNLASLRVETTDLNEIDVARLAVGDSATVTFDALPDVEVQATIEEIAPKAGAGAGVNYAVLVALDSVPDGIRWGMTAFVDIEVSD